MKQKLSVKQERFVAAYLACDFNATEAARQAGYEPSRADVTGFELLQKPHIKAAIAKHTKKTLDKFQLTADRVLQGLANLAFFDIRKLYDADGSLKPITKLDDVTAQALCGLEVEEAFQHFGKGQAKPNGTLKKIKLADRGQNLERLGRYFKLFTDKIEHSADSSLADAIAAARKRAGR